MGRWELAAPEHTWHGVPAEGNPRPRAGVRAVYQQEQYGGHVCPAVLPLSRLRSPRGPASSTLPWNVRRHVHAARLCDKHVVPAISRQQVRAERGVRPPR
ncbi:unnamed protein product [Gadus morhua 'NCC']